MKTEQNEGRSSTDLEPVYERVSSVPINISIPSGIHSFPVLINSSSRFSHRTTLFLLLPIPLLLIYQLSLLLSFAWFAPSYRRVFLLLFCRASTFPPFVSICVGWAGRSMPLTEEADRLPLVPPNLHLSAGILQLAAAAAERKPFSPRTIQNKRRHFFCRRGRGNEISRWLQDQFYCGKCLWIISREWDIDYIDPASCMNWKNIELIRIIQ